MEGAAAAGLRSMLGATKRRRSAGGGAQTADAGLRRRRTAAEPGITARLAKREADAGRTTIHTFEHVQTFLDMKLHVRLPLRAPRRQLAALHFPPPCNRRARGVSTVGPAGDVAQALLLRACEVAPPSSSSPVLTARVGPPAARPTGRVRHAR
jgi:hypothetical protein